MRFHHVINSDKVFGTHRAILLTDHLYSTGLLVTCRTFVFENLAAVGLVTATGIARTSGAARAADLVIPREVGVVLADPPDTLANRAISFGHRKEAHGPGSKDR
jgi:hypothetical protein